MACLDVTLCIASAFNLAEVFTNPVAHKDRWYVKDFRASSIGRPAAPALIGSCGTEEPRTARASKDGGMIIPVGLYNTLDMPYANHDVRQLR
jgi:hypothetical protein